VARHVSELAAALRRRGLEVHVFARLGHLGQLKYDLIDGVHYHRCPLRLNPDFVLEMNNMCNSFVWHMGEVEAYQGHHFDLVHGHDWLASKGIVQIKNAMARRVVLTLHSTEYGRCGNAIYSGQSGRIRDIEAEGAYVADRVITVSGALADEVKWLYNIPGGKLRTIPNGVNCKEFDVPVDAGACRRMYGIGPLDPMVLFVGRLSTQKGPDLLLEAVPHILMGRGDAKIVFVGDGHMRPDLERRARDLGVSGSVRFLGAKGPGANLIELYKSCDLVCVPSRNEPFGIVVLEAWAAGKPVVATRWGGPGQLIEHNQNGLLVYDNPQSIGWGVNEIFHNFPHARWMGERGRARAVSAFSWDTIAGQTEGVYRELVGSV
jgi:glycosyltransferase involved in cell wall biosynthesis